MNDNSIANIITIIMSQLEKGPEGQSNGLDGSRRGENNE